MMSHEEQPLSHAEPILVWRDKLLPKSETFIPRHYNPTGRFFPIFAGLEHIASGLDVASPLLVRDHGHLALARFRLTGRLSSFERRVLDLKPRLIHAHFGKSAARVLPMAEALGLPLVASFHGGDATKAVHFQPYWRRPNVFAARRRRLGKQARLFLTDSSYLRMRLIERGFPADRVLTHWIGLDVDHIKPGLPEMRAPILLFVGRMVEKKGAIDLVKAMAYVTAAVPELRLIMIGEGPLRSSLERQARGLPVCFSGWCSPSETWRMMAHSAIIVVPSRIAQNGDCEGLPSVIYEAAAAATPVVATRHAGIPEAVEDNQTGFLVPEGDSYALAQAIIRLWRAPEVRIRMGITARCYAEQFFHAPLRRQILEERFTHLLTTGCQ